MDKVIESIVHGIVYRRLNSTDRFDSWFTESSVTSDLLQQNMYKVALILLDEFIMVLSDFVLFWGKPIS